MTRAILAVILSGMTLMTSFDRAAALGVQTTTSCVRIVTDSLRKLSVISGGAASAGADLAVATPRRAAGAASGGQSTDSSGPVTDGFSGNCP